MFSQVNKHYKSYGGKDYSGSPYDRASGKLRHK